MFAIRSSSAILLFLSVLSFLCSHSRCESTPDPPIRSLASASFLRYYGKENSESHVKARFSADGGSVYIGGVIEGYGATAYSLLVTKMSLLGSIHWSKSVSYTVNLYLMSMEVTSGGDVLLAASTSETISEIIVMKLDGLGTLIWSQLISSSSSQFASKI